jgi:hypothetical protein
MVEKTTLIFSASPASGNPRGRNSELMRMANSLEIGEKLFIPREERALTGFISEPTALVHNSSHNPRALLFGKRFSTERQKSGKLQICWLVTLVQ